MVKRFCDLCEKEASGTDDCGQLKITLLQSCANPLAELRFSNGNFQNCKIEIELLCFNCQRKLSRAIFDSLKDILTPQSG